MTHFFLFENPLFLILKENIYNIKIVKNYHVKES